MYGYGYQYGKISGGGGGLPFTPPLDVYTGAAAAYSFRLLRTAYAGSAIRVRRSSDNAEQDIGFVSGVLDTASLLTFCGVGDGFVTTWYDQSSNARNLLQTTAAAQPRIVNSGTLDVVNSLAAMLADGTNDTMTVAYTASNPTTQFFVYDKVGTTGWLGGLLNNISTAPILQLVATGVLAYQQGPQFSPTYANNNQALVTLKSSTTGTNWAMWGNGSAITNSGENIGTTSPNKIELFSRGNGTQFANAYMQEYIVYGSDKTSDRVGIETNINSYYGIY